MSDTTSTRRRDNPHVVPDVVPALRCDCGLLFPLGSELEENHGC